MANRSKLSLLFIISLILALLISSTTTNARPLMVPATISSSSNLQARLKLDADGDHPSLNCWDSLIHLQSCSGEIILFFLNGETYLGHSCCKAISTIGKHCWPSMIYALGFTTEEGDILEGYCDHETSDRSFPSTPSSPASVGFNVVTPTKT